jgi:hypothetical protein
MNLILHISVTNAHDPTAKQDLIGYLTILYEGLDYCVKNVKIELLDIDLDKNKKKWNQMQSFSICTLSFSTYVTLYHLWGATF